MMMIRVCVYGFLMLLGSWCQALGAEGATSWQSSFFESFAGVSSGDRVTESDVTENLDAFHRETTRALNPKDQVSAVLSIWFFASDDKLLELTWWRSKNSVTRAAIVSCYLCMTAEPTSLTPPFGQYVERFSIEERERRGQEIDWVDKNRSAIAAAILEWAENNLDPSETNDHAARKVQAYRQMSDRNGGE